MQITSKEIKYLQVLERIALIENSTVETLLNNYWALAIQLLDDQYPYPKGSMSNFDPVTTTQFKSHKDEPSKIITP